MGFNPGVRFSSNFQRFLAAKLYVGSEKGFRGVKIVRTSSMSVPSIVELGLLTPPVCKKTFDVFWSVSLLNGKVYERDIAIKKC